jgi:hypothetical protein
VRLIERLVFCRPSVAKALSALNMLTLRVSLGGLLSLDRSTFLIGCTDQIGASESDCAGSGKPRVRPTTGPILWLLRLPCSLSADRRRPDWFTCGKGRNWQIMPPGARSPGSVLQPQKPQPPAPRLASWRPRGVRVNYLSLLSDGLLATRSDFQN